MALVPWLRTTAITFNFPILRSLIIVCLYDRMWQIVSKTNPLSNTNKLGQFIHYALDECIYTGLIFVSVGYYGNTEQHREIEVREKDTLQCTVYEVATVGLCIWTSLSKYSSFTLAYSIEILTSILTCICYCQPAL